MRKKYYMVSVSQPICDYFSSRIYDSYEEALDAYNNNSGDLNVTVVSLYGDTSKERLKRFEGQLLMEKGRG